MPKTSTYAGITQGLASTAQYMRDRPEREMRLAEAKNRQQLSQLKLQEAQTGAPIRQAESQLQLEKLENDLRGERATRLKTDTFRAFDRYEGDDDVRHLNNFLAEAKANPVGQQTWSQWTRFDPVIRNPETEAMLSQAGIDDVEAFFSDPNLVKSKILGTDSAGQKTMLDLNRLYQMTGYTQYADARTRSALMDRAKLEDLMKGTRSAETNFVAKIAEEEGISTLEAAKRYYQLKNSGKTTGSTVERTATKLMAENPELSHSQALSQAARTIAGPGGAEKDVSFSQGVRQSIHKAAGGDFYEADLADPKVRRKVGEHITELERATKSELSTEDKRLARDYRALAELGETVGEELTPEQTGIIDNMMHEFKQYFSDNTEGTAATASYNTFRNFARNALMGATLTPAEIKSYNEAAGTLKQQLGPVLAKFKVQMTNIRSRLKAIYDMNDPMIAEYYLGTSQEHLDQVIENVERRIQLLDSTKIDKPELKVSPKKVILATPDTSIPNEGKSAAEFWKELGASQ